MSDTGLEALKNALARAGLAWDDQASLHQWTTFKLGGPCPLLVHCPGPAAVTRAVHLLADAGQPFLLIGGGSNLLVADAGVDRVVLRYVTEHPHIVRDGARLRVTGGTALDALARYATNHGFGGLVNASGIPGTVGGAIAGNAGAFGWPIADCLHSVTLLTRAGERYDVTPDAIGFGYRDSGLKTSGDLVLGAVIEAAPADPVALRAERQRILELRAEKHPDLKTWCSAGSFFRNLGPTSRAERRQAAGFFLEQAGAKLLRVGGAGVFPKHANIVVKVADDCRARDVYDLSRQMQAAVKEKFHLDLVREVQLVGDFPPPA